MEYVEKKLDVIDSKIDKLDGRLDRIEVVQAEQAKDIKHHIARTDALQEVTMNLQSKYDQFKGAIKVLGAIFGSGFIGYLIIEIIKMKH